ncbi:MAG TPA: ABC transporter ATP-binding protein [Bacillota bacterium]|nr:ABC transporter ATP-binding protein [Bacillota bacterium]
MIQVTDLTFAYGAHPVLRGINMEVRGGEIGAVMGKNGSGKTTLFKNLLGICRPQSGEVLFEGTDVTKISARERAKMMAYVPQEIRFGALSVYDSVLMGRVARFGMHAGKTDRDAVEKLLCEMKLEHKAFASVDELSGGERRKVAVARALAQEPRLLIFDEPTGNLDLANEILVINEAKALALERGICVLCSLHDLNQALALADRFFFMKDGIVKYQGTAELFTQELISDVYDVNVRIIEHEGEKIILGEKTV